MSALDLLKHDEFDLAFQVWNMFVNSLCNVEAYAILYFVQ